VVRNRWKRAIREAFRLTREGLPKGVDLVVIPRRGAEPDLRHLRKSLPKLAQRVASKLTEKQR
jgi:ribonuclease P protein component